MARHFISQMNGSTEWMSEARCKNITDLFFSYEAPEVELAKSICETCPVKVPCLDYAVSNNIDHGVWGGLDEKERLLYKKGANYIIVQEIAH